MVLSLPHLPKDDTRWYVVQTLPKKESGAAQNLARQSFSIFCPQMRKTVSHARKTSEVLAPLFPGYLFLLMDANRTRWRSINGTFGVAHLLMQGNLPLPVPHGVVETLRLHADEFDVVDRNNGLKIGQSVRILDGAFSDLVGQLEYLDDKGRVRILLDMMGRSVCVTSQVDKLAPVA